MNIRSVAFALTSVMASALIAHGSDFVTETSLSRYRGFRLGEPLADVAKQAGIALPEVILVSTRPARIEELDWRIRQFSNAPKADSVREIVFRFYNGALFEMVVTYDREQTGGLTDADMTEALAAVYGPGTAPAAKEIVFNSRYSDTARAIAQWGDTQNLVTLVGLSFGDDFGIVVSSTRSQALARAALLESERLDRLEAPQKDLDLRAKQLADTQARDEKSRMLNKPGFRP